MSAPPLRRMAAALAEAARPLRVVVFGSHAAGTAGPDSDVDLLVVEEGPFPDEAARAAEMVRLWRALAPFRTPTDLVVVTEAEAARWGRTTNHVVARALREGRVLYERP